MSPKLSLGNVVSGDFQYTPPTQKIRTKTEINSIITEINEYIDELYLEATRTAAFKLHRKILNEESVGCIFMHLLDQNQNGEGVQVNFDCLSTEVESLMTIDQRLEIKQHTFTFDSDKTPNLIDMFTEILDQIISDCSSYDPKDVWNVPKMGDLIQKMGIQKVVIYLIKSHFVNAEFLLKFQKNFQKIFKCVIFVFDGTSVISTLPFDAAIDIEMNELCGRSMKDIVCDIITDLLRQGLVISKILIDYLLTRRSKTRLKHSLSIALLEHTQKYSAGAADKTVVDYVENLWLGFSLLIDVAGVLGIREMKSFLLGSVDTFKSSLESGNVPTTISSKDSTSFPVGDHIHNSSNHQWVQKSMVINQLICLPKFKKIRGYLNLDDHKTLHELVKSIGTLVRVDLRSIDDWRCVYVEFGQFMRKMKNPRIAETIHLAMTNPSFYLCGKLIENDSKILSNDTCLLYRFVIECNLYINMHDLYINFCGALENLDGDLKLSRSEDRALDKDNFLRFTHSVAELQHLGIISPAMNHRPEHYERTMLITRDQLDSVDL